MLPLAMPFDARQRSAEAERLVMSGEKRLYSKFRAAPYYGGIATADAVGCSFLCAFCWNYRRNEDPAHGGKFFSPQDVADELLAIARRRSLTRFRVTGSEPILGDGSFDHLLKVMGLVLDAEPRSSFILETNGLMLGAHQDWARRLTRPRVLVRLAVKGVDPESFERITGARKEFFRYPLLALRNLEEAEAKAWPALMEDLFSAAQVKTLENTLRDEGILSELELETLERYPSVLENLKRRGVSF